jgi:hypothetical protein
MKINSRYRKDGVSSKVFCSSLITKTNENFKMSTHSLPCLPKQEYDWHKAAQVPEINMRRLKAIFLIITIQYSVIMLAFFFLFKPVL